MLSRGVARIFLAWGLSSPAGGQGGRFLIHRSLGLVTIIHRLDFGEKG